MKTVLAIFSYRRAENLERIKHSLNGAKIDHIYHFCDAARASDDLADVNLNRETAESFSKEFSQTVILRESNYGLSKNLLEGLSYVFSRHESAIILEDDVIPRPGFFAFMHSALARFSNERNVFSVSGYQPLHESQISVPDFFFSRRFFCWGWATWADRWQALASKFESEAVPYNNYWDVPKTCGNDYEWALRNHLIGRKPLTWAYRVGIHTLNQDMLHLCCRDVLIENIGFDGTGENCPPDAALANSFPEPRMANHLLTESKHPELSPAIDAAISDTYTIPENSKMEQLRRRISYYMKSRFRD